MLMKTCARCGRLIPYGRSYCSDCQSLIDQLNQERMKERAKEYNKEYNRKRDPKYLRFYNSKEWRMLRDKYTQDRGYRCEACGAIATQVHHKQAIQTPEGWLRRLDYSNLELLCTECHNKRHDRFKRKRGKTTNKGQIMR